ncbi:TIGR02281 family clan AA aspartic protease [Pseudovibrio sp. Tun.PSC04-5.I4]|uniref:retropepsin-like aspartic protease family protein n=1 Tax=Pseudovibrio sp. Tun.PSC04-5.I4 TaxID=1798213 RepID=UPI0008917F15|nr:TIGR02281 family clan AA aspartic protease [Pseudovibrio sp. Tun.PSC04-5.I4]SDQ91200.1 aspartyl protease family protein [Pseudovibrio sp. Tun.PSC04-5.I4]
MRWTIGFVILIGAMMLGVTTGYLGTPDFLGDKFQEDGPRIVALAAMGIVIAMGVFIRRPALKQVFSAVMFWGGLGLLLIIGYSFRYELMTVRDRVMSELLPGSVTQSPDGEVLISRGIGNQFVIEVQVDGVGVDMLVDTGASHITLSYRDAKRVGLDPADLTFSTPVSTANGMGFVARVRLDDMRLGSWKLQDLPAFVAQEDMLSTSLLGMSALNTFASWRVEGNQLVLNPR